MSQKPYAGAIRDAAQQIINDVQHLKHGYSFWTSIPSAKQIRVKRAFCSYIYQHLFPQTIKESLVSITIDTNGIPKNSELYKWIVNTIYFGDERQVYKDWLRLRRSDEYSKEHPKV